MTRTIVFCKHKRWYLLFTMQFIHNVHYYKFQHERMTDRYQSWYRECRSHQQQQKLNVKKEVTERSILSLLFCDKHCNNGLLFKLTSIFIYHIYLHSCWYVVNNFLFNNFSRYKTTQCILASALQVYNQPLMKGNKY